MTGKFQLQALASRKKKFNLLSGIGIFCPGGFIGLLTKTLRNVWEVLSYPKEDVMAKKWGHGGSYGGVFGLNVPLAVLNDS